MRSTTCRPAPDDFRAALRHVIAPVAIVATRDGTRTWGMTVSAFSVLCLDPPSFVLCVNAATATAAHVREQGELGLNILADHQSAISQRCALPGESKHIDPSLLVARDDGSSRLLLRDTVASFECDARTLDVDGSHLLVVATVRRGSAADAQPLLYGSGTYLRGVPLEPAVIE